ncbi:MAG: patatin-like phospholipase family protein [Candidatus Omnitrophota bacterium]|nr:patatin-like phospholipase family protein [Candidatus Omnitrophota bacterium]
MGLFQFGRKIEASKEYSLSDIPIFSSLTTAEHRLIEKMARIVEFKRGDIVYHEGAASDALYVVIAGRFRLFTTARGGETTETLIFFYRGDHFGEASLLTNKPHSATAEAKRDSLVLRLDKDDFLKLIQDIPGIALHLSRALGHRLTRSEEGGGIKREVKIAALYTTNRPDGIFLFWVDLAASVVRESRRKVILIDFAPVADCYGEVFEKSKAKVFDLSQSDPTDEGAIKSCLIMDPSDFCYINVKTQGESEEQERKIGAMLSFLTYRYDFLLVRLPRDVNSIAFHSLKKSDMVYVHCDADPGELAESAEVLNQLERHYGFSRNELKVLVSGLDEEHIMSFEDRERILGHRIFSLLPDRRGQLDWYKSTLRFLSKELAGNLLGLVLGSGAAYGLAHIGVLKVLQRENISVDVIAGSSIGALIGAYWAAGYDADELERMALTIDKKTGFFRLVGFRDFSLPHLGFFKGNQVVRFLQSYLGHKTFQELRIPLKIVATNLHNSDKVVFRTGRVVDAIRASISIPGIFRPYQYRGMKLMDGGIIDPLPVRVLTDMGVKRIIAVNVLPGPKDWAERFEVQMESRREKAELASRKNIWSRTLLKSLERLSERYDINVFNVIMKTIQFMEYEMAQTWGIEADVLIHPITKNGHWAEFYDAEKFIRVGEQSTQEQLDEIKQLIAE